MESPDHTQTQTAASAAHKCSNGKENDGAPSLAARVRDALRSRPLTDRGAARDAVEEPQREIIELSDGERDALRRAELALEQTQPTAPKVAQDPSDRKRRADARAKAKGDNPSVDAFESAPSKVGTQLKNRVGRDAYAPKVMRSDPERPRHPIDWEKWGVYKRNEQIEEDIARLRSITIGGKSALDVGVAAANAAGETFFGHFEDMVPQNITERAGRAAALTTVATNKLANAAMAIDVLKEERTTEEGPHVQPLRDIREQLKKLGAVEGSHGTVEGPLKPFACRHTYHGHVGTGQKTEVSEIGCLLRKFIIIGSYLGDLSDIVEDGVDCSFGNRTMKLKKYESLASDKAGNFGSAARDGVPLCEEHQNPRDTRFEIEKYLRNGPLGEDAWGVIGKFGDLLKDAAARGKGKIFFFPMGEFDVSTLKVSDVVPYSKRPIRDVARREASWKATLATCKVKAPVLFYVYDALFQLGMMHAPNTKRSEYDCLKDAWNVIDSWRRAKSPLADSFVSGFGDGAKLIILTDAFEKMQKWPAGAPYARTLLDYAGVETLSELVLVKGDSSDGRLVPNGRPFSGGYRLVPKHLAVDDGHGGYEPKRKKVKRGTGNGPVEFTCHRCGHTWRPEVFSKAKGHEGQAQCQCLAFVKPPA
jgi:hypothetical protein